MAATVTPLLTDIDLADSSTNWTGGDVTTDNEPIQGSRNIGTKASNTTARVYYNFGSTLDVSDEIIYVWMFASTRIDVTTAGGMRIYMGASNGSDYGEWYVAGQDTYPGGWKCYAVKCNLTDNPFDNSTVSPPAMTAVQYFGATFVTTTQIMGNFDNVQVDAIRVGTGLKITGASSGTPGTFDDILAEATTNKTNSYGIIREDSNVFFIQGELQFGDQTTATWFSDSSKTLVFEKHFGPGATSSDFFTDDLIGISTVNTSSVTLEFQLGTKQGSGDTAVGANPINIQSPQVRYSLDFSDPDIDSLNLYGSTFLTAGTVTFGDASNALTGANVELIDNTFADTDRLVRNISGTTTEVRNQINFSADGSASLDIVDGRDTDDEEWTMIQGPGFIHSQTASTTLNISDHTFALFTTPYIYLTRSETWNSINPTWTITDQTELDFSPDTATGAVVNEKYTLDVRTKTPSGTALENARSFVYEADDGTGSEALPSDSRQSSSSTGFATSDVLTKVYEGAASSALTTTFHSDFAIKVYKYNYSPFVAAQTLTAKVELAVALTDDTNISETTATDARTLGDTTNTVSIENQTNSASIVKYTGGSGTLTVGETMIGKTSTQTGTVLEILEGDSTSGTVLINSRSSGDFTAAGEVLSETGGTSDWTANMTASTETRYKWLIDADTLTMQQLYDYLLAKFDESPIDEASPSFIDDVIIWGANEHGTPVQVSGSKFKTVAVTNDTKSEGWAVYDTTLSGVAFFTADDDSTFIPAESVTLTVQGATEGARVAIIANETTADNTSGDVIVSGETNSSGVFSATYTRTVDQGVDIKVRLVGYLPFQTTGTITSSGLTVTAVWQLDTISDRVDFGVSD